MPDKDKFERQLSGKQWRKAYRLARGNGEIPDLAKLLTNATDDVQRNGLGCPALVEVSEVLYEALDQPLLASFDSANVRRQLLQRLEDIEYSHSSFPGTRLAVEAAQSVYVENLLHGLPANRKQVSEHLRKKFIERILEDQFFSRVRQGIMKETGRTSQEQSDWEKQVIEAITSSKRNPRKRVSPSTWDADRLHQPIQILER